MAVGDPREVLSRLTAETRAVITTHVNPDGDGIGSEVALAELIRARGGEAQIVNHDGVPTMLEFLNGDGMVKKYDAKKHDESIRSANLIIAVDNADPRRFRDVLTPIKSSDAHKLCIDHHPNPDPYWDQLWVDTDAACTGQLICDLYDCAEVAPSARAAEALYVALITDTGRFRFSNTNSRAFSMAASLSATHVTPSRVYAKVEERISFSFAKLMGRILSAMESHAGGRLLVLRAPYAEIKKAEPFAGDLSDVINVALQIKSSTVAVMFREISPTQTKVSLRSKTHRDVNALARRHGGGGHKNASGIVIDRPLDKAIEHLQPELIELAAT